RSWVRYISDVALSLYRCAEADAASIAGENIYVPARVYRRNYASIVAVVPAVAENAKPVDATTIGSQELERDATTGQGVIDFLDDQLAIANRVGAAALAGLGRKRWAEALVYIALYHFNSAGLSRI